MQQIRLYCKAHDKENPSRYEMTETQILRFKKENTSVISFKLYNYCKNSTQVVSDSSYEWMICLIPEIKFIPNYFSMIQSSPYIKAEIKTSNDVSIFTKDKIEITSEMFSLQIPKLAKGMYTLIVTYTADEVVSKSFPLIITN